MLLDLVRPHVSPGSTVLDIGGGIGVVDHELLRMGAGHAVMVDASPAYLEVARDEARRRMTLDRLELLDGDFVARAPWVERADIVTLDRVVCCYPDAESLVACSAARARRVYGLVLPRDSMLTRLSVRLMNLWYRIRRRGYRAFAHSNAAIDRLAGAQGLSPIAERTTWYWRVVVYERLPAA